MSRFSVLSGQLTYSLWGGAGQVPAVTISGSHVCHVLGAPDGIRPGQISVPKSCHLVQPQ